MAIAYNDPVQSPISPPKGKTMAKSLDAELAALAADERKLVERRQALQTRQREAAIGAVEKAGLFKLPLAGWAAHEGGESAGAG